MIFGNHFKIYRGFLNARKNLESFCTSVPSEELKGESLLDFRHAQDYAYLEILGQTDNLYNFPKNYSLDDFSVASRKIDFFLKSVNDGLFEGAIQQYD